MRFVLLLIMLFCNLANAEVRLINANESEWQPGIEDWGCTNIIKHRDHPHDVRVLTDFWLSFVYFREQVTGSTNFELDQSKVHLSIFHPEKNTFEYAIIVKDEIEVKLESSQYNADSDTYIADSTQTYNLSKIFSSGRPFNVTLKYSDMPIISREIHPKFYKISDSMYRACIK